MKKFIFLVFLFFVALPILHPRDVIAQNKAKQLVFTKAMIDKKTLQVWFEIFNPADESIALTSFRISGIKIPNVLPAGIRRNNGIVLKPGERLIVCGDKPSFEKKYGVGLNIMEIKLLMNLDDGGFVAMNHLEGVENSNNIIRYGQRSKSIFLTSKISDDQLLNITDDGMCYAREVNSNGELPKWTKIIPAPGKERKEMQK